MLWYLGFLYLKFAGIFEPDFRNFCFSFLSVLARRVAALAYGTFFDFDFTKFLKPNAFLTMIFVTCCCNFYVLFFVFCLAYHVKGLAFNPYRPYSCPYSSAFTQAPTKQPGPRTKAPSSRHAHTRATRRRLTPRHDRSRRQTKQAQRTQVAARRSQP